MRNFQTLDQAAVNTETGTITFTAQIESDAHPTLAMRREGNYVVISASYGPLEIALRQRFGELVRTFTHLQPNDGLMTTRQVGTSEAYLALGRHTDGSLIFRPTVVGDAGGYFCLNLMLIPATVITLTAWLGEDTELPNRV